MLLLLLLLLLQVTMGDKTGADRACKDPNPVIDGRKANVNLAYIGAKPRVMQATGKDQCGQCDVTGDVLLRHVRIMFMSC